MRDIKKLSHVVWECKCHLVWCPKYRLRILKGEVGRSVRDIIKQLCEWKNVGLLEGNVQVDHIHLVLSFPPKYSIRQVWMQAHTYYFGVDMDMNGALDTGGGHLYDSSVVVNVTN